MKKRRVHSHLRDINKRYGRAIRSPIRPKGPGGRRHAKASSSGNKGRAVTSPAIRKNRMILWSTVIVFAAVLGCLSHVVSLRTIHTWGESINGWLLFSLILFLPLIGMPMSICGVLIGAKFGVVNGLAVTAVAVLFHLVASWGIARSWFQKPIKKLLQKTRYKIPSLEMGEYAGVCLLTALIPGPSYTLKNYFLALSNLPLGIIIGVGLPANLFAMSPGILFGSFTGAMTWPKGVFLAGYAILLFVACHWVVRMIRTRSGRMVKPAAA
jgi:uncharacterized membrane protein YdjX (TVP38/TMEM64 family)